MMEILIFGTGSVARVLLDNIREDVKILAFINSDVSIKEFYGYQVILPEQIVNYPYDYIVIASGYTKAIHRILAENGVADRKIVEYIFDDAEVYQEINNNIGQYLNTAMNRAVMENVLKDKKLLPQMSVATVWKNNGFAEVYKDFVREQTLSYLSQEISRKKLQGSVVELGVYKGDFSIMLQKAFPEKTLILFDTFEGFSNADVKGDSAVDNKEYELKKFKDTSADFVLSRLGNRENVRIKQGYFPDSFDLWDEEFAFVSVDLNLSGPVKKSLEIFYPRLVRGGYILVSDYNAPFYEGTREAVMDYCDSNGITYMPIPDLYGSVVIAK